MVPRRVKDTPKVRAVRLTDKEYEFLKSMNGGNASEGLRNLVREKMDRELQLQILMQFFLIMIAWLVVVVL